MRRSFVIRPIERLAALRHDPQDPEVVDAPKEIEDESDKLLTQAEPLLERWPQAPEENLRHGYVGGVSRMGTSAA